MLSKLLSDSFWRGNDVFVCGRISGFGIFVEGTFDLGSNIGSDGEDGVASASICSGGVSGFVSDFYLKKGILFYFSFFSNIL
jgi:hypothetical protein